MPTTTNLFAFLIMWAIPMAKKGIAEKDSLWPKPADKYADHDDTIAR